MNYDTSHIERIFKNKLNHCLHPNHIINYHVLNIIHKPKNNKEHFGANYAKFSHL